MTRDEFKKRLDETDKTLENFIDEIHNELVPDRGEAKTVAGEVFRAMGRIGYRYYNDGDYFYDGYGLGTVAPSMQYILDIIERYGSKEDYNKVLDIIDQTTNGILEDRDYWNNILKIFNIVVNTLLHSKEDLFISQNSENSRNYDASWFEDNRPLYDCDFDVDEKITQALDKGVIDRADVLDYVKEDLSVFGWDREDEIDVRLGYHNDFIIISNLTSDEYNEVEGWNKNYHYWDNFKEEYKDELSELDKDDNLEESLSQEYLDRCKKVKEDYMKFNLSKKELKEDFTEDDLDDDAARRCCFKYNCGRRQLMDMLKEVI